MRIRYTETALAEIAQIISYIETDNARAASAVAAELERVIRRIAKYPSIGRVVYEGGVRAVLVGRYQYRLFYTAAGEDVIIRNVRHTRRQRPWEDE